MENPKRAIDIRILTDEIEESSDAYLRLIEKALNEVGVDAKVTLYHPSDSFHSDQIFP